MPSTNGDKDTSDRAFAFQTASSLGWRHSGVRDVELSPPDKARPARPRSLVASPQEISRPWEARPISWPNRSEPTAVGENTFVLSEIQQSPERRESTASKAQYTPDLSVSLRKQLRGVQRLADKAVRSQFDLEYQQDTLENCRRFLEQSTGECLQMVRGLLSKPPNEWETLLQSFETRMKNDHIAFRAQSNRLAVVRSDLKQLQDRLKSRAEKVSKSLESVNLDIPTTEENVLDAMGSESEISSAATHSPTVSETPSLLDRFHTRKGELFVLYERVEELEAKYQDDRSERNFLRDRDESLEISDTAFEADYNDKRRNLANQIVLLQKDVDKIGEECLKAGFDIVDAFSTSGDESSEPVPDIQLKPINANHNKLRVHRETSILRNLPDYVPKQNRHFVRGWLEGVHSLSDPGTPLFSDKASSAYDGHSPALDAEHEGISLPSTGRESRRVSFRDKKPTNPFVLPDEGARPESSNETQSSRPRSRRSLSNPESSHPDRSSWSSDPAVFDALAIQSSSPKTNDTKENDVEKDVATADDAKMEVERLPPTI